MSEGPSSSPVLELHFELRTLDEVRISQAPIRRFAAELGFDRAAQWQVTIAASEAGTNMVKYGGGGRLTLRRIVEPRVGLRLEARDHGPGIGDLELALRDHLSEGRGLGLGLGAIQRMMDALGWQNLADGGLLWAEKYLDAR
ncbi:MAG TPA: ATP-binding protein [Enhygromyxa sp.]|nr:ATP-binding protein [Enhygromyxa sp.]